MLQVHLRRPGAPPEPTLSFPRLQNDLFTVRHYAEEVTYTARGFRDKSVDSVHQGAIALVCSSMDPFVASLFGDDPKAVAADAAEVPVEASPSRSLFGRGTPSKGGTRRTLSLGSQFKAQLGALVGEINDTQVHYARCIKPNDSASPTPCRRLAHACALASCVHARDVSSG